MGQEYNKYRYSRCHMTSGTLVELLSNSFRNYGSRPMLTLYISYMALSHIPYLARWSYLGNLRKTPYAVYFKNDSLMQLIFLQYCPKNKYLNIFTRLFCRNKESCIIRTWIPWVPTILSLEGSWTCILTRYITYWTTSSASWIVCLAISKSIDDPIVAFAFSYFVCKTTIENIIN